MLSLKRLAESTSLLLCLSASAPANAQDNPKQRVPREDAATYRVPEPSELAKENLGRVAASAAQIREVLAKDAGILVELKRWIAKEATDNGQIVEDSSLTDDAVFDRLDHDIAFRSVATRLVQRYGYLLPAFNPDSEIGKQQEFVLKERARRLVQIEAQEDSQSLQPGKPDEYQGQQVERTSCDQQRQENCDQLSLRRSRSQSPQWEESPSGTEPNPPTQQELSPRTGSSRTLRAAGGSGEPDLQDSWAPGTDGTLTLASDPLKHGQEALGGRGPISAIDGMANPPRSNSEGSLSPFAAGNTSERERTTSSGGESTRTVRLPGERSAQIYSEKDLVPVAMVHKSNPYADIPSLYDMYVQAASRDREPEFGLAVFRNGTRQLDSLPMDLPVGPDYVVGPGDGLAINLWGGISQRITLVVNREGRINLPEAGPLLVSGRSLGEIQQAVQQAIGTQFRDTSADVSLSRLRTIRVYIVGEVAEPGAYDISSLSTPLNALFAAGGVTPRGSLRNLKHYRGKQLIEDVDAYSLLLRGVGSDLKRLENGDSLLVPPVDGQVTVSGMVRRPAIYELHGENSLADVLDLAGGILPAATLKHIEVQRLEAHEKRTMLSLDLSANGDADAVGKQLAAFKIQDGDQIHIFPIAPYNESSIFLQGHVLRPGRYSYREGMKLTDVVASYNDLLPEPAGRYAEIVRLNPPDYRPSVESFDLSAALANPPTAPKLQPLDTIRVFSRFDFEPAPAVWIGGEVRTPGKYRVSGQVRLRDAIYQAGGLSPDASQIGRAHV